MDPLRKALKPERLTAVVDVGANFIPEHGPAPYRPLLDAGLCTLVGFEPQRDAFDKLLIGAGPNEKYLGVALGDGTRKTLRVLECRGMSSVLKPNMAHLKRFNDLDQFGRVVSEQTVETERLDDVAEIGQMDFLKIDVQGAELEIFRNGRERLSSAVAVQTEVSFVQLYEGQPTFGDIDRELRSLGMIPHCIQETATWPIAPLVVGGDRRRATRQIMEADLVYVRDFTDDDNLSAEQWKHLALIMHHCYQSFDLTARCLQALGKDDFLSVYCEVVGEVARSNAA